MPFGLGIWEIVVLIGVLLLIVGPAKAPGVARMFGRGVREVRETVDAPRREITEALTGGGHQENPRSSEPRPSTHRDVEQ